MSLLKCPPPCGHYWGSDQGNNCPQCGRAGFPPWAKPWDRLDATAKALVNRAPYCDLPLVRGLVLAQAQVWIPDDMTEARSIRAWLSRAVEPDPKPNIKPETENPIVTVPEPLVVEAVFDVVERGIATAIRTNSGRTHCKLTAEALERMAHESINPIQFWQRVKNLLEVQLEQNAEVMEHGDISYSEAQDFEDEDFEADYPDEEIRRKAFAMLCPTTQARLNRAEPPF